ncbi:MAG: Spy/CpxP family protein refolding chaperone [Campylobacterales bacterium]|nr:Spy/CpxP family protein refolding chaperone [Campylobacterales bacterium]
MLRKIILAGASASLLSLSAFAACDNNGMGCDKPMKHKQEKGAKGCDMRDGIKHHDKLMSLSTVKLTPEQKLKIDAINEEFRTEMAKLRIKDKGMRDPFVVAGGFDKEAFKKTAMEKMQKHLDMRAEHLAKIWAVLTPEQQKNITALAK